ncbi:hypothetical protein ACTL6P_02740 [Endozoicomonas acroporae]|uniref:hypothetical protein n=1 Tax=Endozoicomonas acroporae TaxID=1701104 RepID=UPI000C7805EB|nr:hypothetical protein [Endozoicomonas acroporae]
MASYLFNASEQMLRLCSEYRYWTTIILWGCDDNGLLAQDEDGVFKIHGYDSNGHWCKKAVGNTGTKLYTGSFSPSGRVLFTCDDDRSASIWKITPSE